MKRLTTKRVKIENLNLDEGNPRVITKEKAVALAKSIDRFGLVQPIIVNRITQRVVGGHQRLEALKQLGEKEVDIVVVELSDEDEKALNLTLNSTEVQGEWNVPLLSLRLEELSNELDGDSFEDLRLDALALQIEELTDFSGDFEDLGDGGSATGTGESEGRTLVRWGGLKLDLDAKLVKRVERLVVKLFEVEDRNPEDVFEEIIISGLDTITSED